MMTLLVSEGVLVVLTAPPGGDDDSNVYSTVQPPLHQAKLAEN